MKTILIPTDFSANSKSGIRFAINWATHQNANLIFIHVMYNKRPIEWSMAYYEEHSLLVKTKLEARLKTFIGAIYKNMKVIPGNHSFKVIEGISPDLSLLDFCNQNSNIDYICISTRGAGGFNKILGTNTGNLITKSPIPVMAIPKNTTITDASKILYASDFKNFDQEIDAVINFALPFKAPIDIVHFTWPDETNIEPDKIESELNNKYPYPIHLHLEQNDGVHSLVENIQQQIHLKEPSVVIMFTNQERNFFQKLFLSSKTEELSFQINIPLLVFKK